SPQGTLGRGSRVSERHPVLEATTAASMAFALILLTGAGLLVQSFLRLQAVRLGFDPQGVVVMRIIPPDETYRSLAGIRAFRDRVLAELGRIPHTVAVAAGDRFLIGASPGFVLQVLADDHTNPEPNVIWSWITPDYFSVLRTPLITGRTF